MKLTEEGTDSLFQQYSIKEIQEIERKLRNDIEKKKEDLRQMVGERYQDMMYAAETITDMKLSAISVTNHIKAMEDHCSMIYQKVTPIGILGRQSDTMSTKFTLGVQLKILMETPTTLWSAIDDHRFCDAGEIHLLSQYVMSSLSYDPTSRAPGGKSLQQTFPILNTQMAQCSSYRYLILQRCRDFMRNENLSEDGMSDILCTLLLLDNASPLELMQEFLNIRTSALEHILKKEDLSISEQVCEAVLLFCNTLQHLSNIFHVKEGQKSCLLQKYFEIGSAEKPGPLVHFGPENSQAFSYLPVNIKDFRPTVKTGLNDVSVDDLQGSCQKWLTDVKVRVYGQLTRLLTYVASGKGLSAICEKVEETFNQISVSDWTSICDNVLKQSLSPYQILLEPVVIQRLKEVLSAGWSSAFTDLQTRLSDLLRRLESSNCGYESDLRYYIWEESAGDLSVGSGWPGTAQHFGPLGMKAFGYTPQVQSLCNSLDEQIKNHLADVEAFGAVHLEAKEEQIVFARQLTEEKIESLLHFLCRAGNDTAAELGLPTIGRFCRAFCDLCPSLKHCFPKSEESRWAKLNLKIMDCGQQALRTWTTFIVEKELSCLKHNLTLCSPEDMLRCAMAWDEREISEEMEDGSNLRSKIRIPLQASGFLQSALASVAEKINRRIGHALSRNIIISIGQEVLRVSLACYETGIGSLSTEGQNPRFVQSFALQLLFDVHYLGGVFNDPRATSCPTDQIATTIENLIDPFDLDVFNQALQTNLALAIHKSTFLFGLLLVDRPSSAPPAASQSSPSNLVLSTGPIARFQLLPITQKAEKMTFQSISSSISPKMSRGFGSSPALGGLSDSSDVSKSYSFYDRFSAMGASWFGS